MTILRFPGVPADGPTDVRGEPEHGPAADAPGELVALLEAMLLAAPEPPTVARLAEAAELSVEEIEAALGQLERAANRGWHLVRHGETVGLATQPRFAPQVRRLLGLDREARLSPAALETLAIVAYRQPATRAEIEAVRGVDSAATLATLHARGLVETIGRRAALGSPHEYATTAAFLHYFGLGSLADLPPLGSVAGEDAGALLAAVADGVAPSPVEPVIE